MELKTLFAQDLAGNVIATPSVTLFLPDGVTKATGLKRANGSALSNPFAGGADGRITFAAPDGDYIVKITGAGRTLSYDLRFIDAGGVTAALEGFAADLANAATTAALTAEANARAAAIAAEATARANGDAANTAAINGNKSLASPIVANFTGAGKVRFYANVALELALLSQSGPGTITFQKSTAAAPGNFTAAAMPFSVQAGAWVEIVAAADVAPFCAVAIGRTVAGG